VHPCGKISACLDNCLKNRKKKMAKIDKKSYSRKSTKKITFLQRPISTATTRLILFVGMFGIIGLTLVIRSYAALPSGVSRTNVNFGAFNSSSATWTSGNFRTPSSRGMICVDHSFNSSTTVQTPVSVWIDKQNSDGSWTKKASTNYTSASSVKCKCYDANIDPRTTYRLKVQVDNTRLQNGPGYNRSNVSGWIKAQ
jgi:hypothetical protein